MTDFTSEARAILAEAAQRYKLAFAPVDDSQALLIGRDFAVLFMADFDDVKVAYIMPDEHHGLRMIGFTTYLVTQRLTDEDSALFGKPTGRSAYVMASLRVLASGLLNRCADILSGDTQWLRGLRKKDLGRWAGIAAPPRVADILAPQFEFAAHDVAYNSAESIE